MTTGAPGVGWRGQALYLAWYDFDLPLRDALDDPELDPIRRALAALVIGTGLDDGHLAALELAEAARAHATDHGAGVPDGAGVKRLREILDAPCDDYQRALWYAVSRCPLGVAAEHLDWLARLTRARAMMYPAIQASGACMPLLPRSGYNENSAQLEL